LQVAVDELRRQLVLLSPVAVLENFCSAVATRAQREAYRLLTAEQRASLDQLLSLPPERPLNKLAWLRQSPGEPSEKAMLAHIERLQAVHALGLPVEIGRNIYQNRPLRLARECGKAAASIIVCTGWRFLLRNLLCKLRTS